MQVYYYEGEDRRGPVDSGALRALVSAGRVTPDTVIEVGGRKAKASKVKGLSFPPPVPPAAPEVPAPQPEPVYETKYTPFGSVRVDTTQVPESVAAPGSELRTAAEALEKSARNVGQIGWLFVVSGVLSFVLLLLAGLNSEGGEAAIGAGIGALIGGLLSAQIPFFLARLGRYVLVWTRRNSRD